MKKRIEYIDLARGILSVLTVFRHTGLFLKLPTSVPSFIFLSALFYNTKLDFKSFLIKRLRVLIVPFIFFYISSYLCFIIASIIYEPIKSMTDASGIMDVFFQKQLFNGPLWFLLALFWIHLLYYPIKKFIDSILIRFILSLFLGIIGWYLGYKGFFCPLYFDSALSMMPFFFVGNQIFKLRYLDYKYFGLYLIAFFSIVAIVFCYFNLSISAQSTYNLYGSIWEYVNTIVILTIYSIAILFVCKRWENKINIVKWLGENSMLIMCTHHIIYRPVQLFISHIIPDAILPIIVSFITLLITILFAPLFNKYFPWAIGKIKYEKVN